MTILGNKLLEGTKGGEYLSAPAVIGLPVNGHSFMIRITAQYFYEIGMALHPLGGVQAGSELDVVGWETLYPAQQRLEYFLKQTVVPVRVCSEVGWRLNKILTDMGTRIGKAEKILPLDAFNIADGLRRFETVLAAELSLLDTYYVSQKGCYSTTQLIEQGEVMFPESIRAFMPAECITDIRQGSKCLAFELATASAFHFLRATESILYKYYDVISEGKARPKMRNMGKYIEALEKISGVNDRVLSVLRQIKNLHRNPIMHPEAVLDMEEAMTLLGIVQSAITTMISFVKKNDKPLANVKVEVPVEKIQTLEPK